MTLCRLIAPQWLMERAPNTRKVIEGQLSETEIQKYNRQGYNVYWRPNHPSEYQEGTNVDGSQIDVWNYVFVDFDLKSKVYPDKDTFIERLTQDDCPPFTRLVDSGGGIHAYWRVSDLDAKSFLRLSRRLMRLLNTDEAVQTLPQLMRYPGTLNTKDPNNLRPCELLYDEEVVVYTCEELDKLLPPITVADEAYCNQHYDKTFNLQRMELTDDSLPPKFGELLSASTEAKEIWAGSTSDRSKDDYRLGHIMFARDFTKEEAMRVLINSSKAMSRAPVHRMNYAQSIIDKIWTYEKEPDKSKVDISPTVRELLSRGEEAITGTRFPCHKWIDDTQHGFRLGQIIGIIGGSGVGKTTLTLNAFLWFAELNPEYHHFFFSLEQPPGEIANRIRTICGANDRLFDKIHIVSNYNADDSYRHMSLEDIEKHLLKWKQDTGLKVGATVIDHIGVLAKEGKNGENDGLIGICQHMKAFAVRVNTLLIMLSQAPREKAGIGDLELDKSAAYGTVFFESFLDYCLCLWQPLKRVYSLGAPTVIALKFAKIRHKKQGADRIQEDVCYQFFFDPATERLRELTQEEERSASFFNNQATNARKKDRKTDVVTYQSRRLEGETDAEKKAAFAERKIRVTNDTH